MCLMFTIDLKLLVLEFRQNKRCQNNFAYEVADFYGSQIKGFYSK